MNLRGLIRDFREVPATMTLGALWIVVFALMALDLHAKGQLHSAQGLVLAVHNGHPFGDLTIAEFQRGEVWRLLTATFVHYGLLHLGLNLWMLYQLGSEVEWWYGSSQFVAIYVAIGSAGNGLSVLFRALLHANPAVHSGGGSVVTLGLVALCAVVGWRSRTKVGNYLRGQMVGVLIATAVLGLIVPILDNWGHAGGALAGAAIGFAHRPLIRSARRRIARWTGALAAAVLLLGAGAQLRDNRVERDTSRTRMAARQRYQAAVAAKQGLLDLGRSYRLAVEKLTLERRQSVLKRSPFGPPRTRTPAAPVPVTPEPLSLSASDATFRAALKERLDWLDARRASLGAGAATPDFTIVRGRLAKVCSSSRLATPEEVREFYSHLAILLQRAQREETEAKASLNAPGR